MSVRADTGVAKNASHYIRHRANRSFRPGTSILDHSVGAGQDDRGSAAFNRRSRDKLGLKDVLFLQASVLQRAEPKSLD
jgi:hypothetical protein